MKWDRRRTSAPSITGRDVGADSSSFFEDETEEVGVAGDSWEEEVPGGAEEEGRGRMPR